MGQTAKDTKYTIRTDEVSDTLSYIGWAYPGSDTAAPVWRIMKSEETGTETIINYADGNDFFDNIWDERDSLTYL